MITLGFYLFFFSCIFYATLIVGAIIYCNKDRIEYALDRLEDILIEKRFLKQNCKLQ